MPKSEDLTIQKKWAIISRYNWYTNCETCCIMSGGVKKISAECKVSEGTIRRIMAQYREQCQLQGTTVPDMQITCKPKSGRPSKLTDEVENEIRDANQATNGRSTIRNLSVSLDISKSTLHRYLKKMNVEIVSTWIKPKLSYDQKIERLRFILGLRSGRTWSFEDQKNVIVVDESWFYLHKTRGYVRLFPGDEMPEPVKVQHKSHIPKIMFLAAVARPNPVHNFNGKILLQRVCEERIAERTSYNHNRGDIYQHDCTITAELYRHYMIDIIAEVKVKMPWLRNQKIIIQQDGASPHVGRGNLDFFYEEGHKNGWDINVVTQPPQSPDLNVNDLGFFRSLKCRVEHLKNGANSIEELFQAIIDAWDEYDAVTLDNIWGHQYDCYREIIRCLGDNVYEALHTGVRNRHDPVDLKIVKQEFREAAALVRRYDGLV